MRHMPSLTVTGGTAILSCRRVMTKSSAASVFPASMCSKKSDTAADQHCLTGETGRTSDRRLAIRTSCKSGLEL